MATRWYKHPENNNEWISQEEYFNILFGDDYEPQQPSSAPNKATE